MNDRQVLDYVRQGMDALGMGRQQQAEEVFVLAARELLQQARQCHGKRREQYTGQAQRLLKYTEMLQHTDTAVHKDAQLTLQDVAGLEELKSTFRARFIYPLKHPEKASRYNQSGAGGMLLYGPPGTGKTFLARALAGELGAPVFSVRPSDIMGAYVGESEQQLADLFTKARQHPLAVVFIDEIDALAPARNPEGSEVMKRLLAQLLAELDGFQRHQGRLIFIGATNEPWALDPALLRPGRFDEHLLVGLPDRAARMQILETNLQQVYLAPYLDMAVLAELTEGYSGADLFGLCIAAPQYAYLDLCEKGVERPVQLIDFKTAMRKQPPSVSAQMMKRYQAFS